MVQLSSKAHSLVVKKRNGQQVAFFDVRIYRAVASAFKAHLGVPHESDLEASEEAKVQDVTRKVVEWCEKQSENNSVVFIEDIQDAVVQVLKENNLSEIAERYNIYRQQHDMRRYEAERITVKKRDGRSVSFKPDKIAYALGKAFSASTQKDLELDGDHRAKVLNLADSICQLIRDRFEGPFTIGIEEIQDMVELTLMEQGHHDIARRYIHYREQRRLERHGKPKAIAPVVEEKVFKIKHSDGSFERLDVEKLKVIILNCCHGLEDKVSVDQILAATLKNCVDGMDAEKLTDAISLAVRPLIEKEPAYSFVAARILLRKIYGEVSGSEQSADSFKSIYKDMLKQSIELGVEYKRLSPELLTFDFEKLGKAIKTDRDYMFHYMGLQILYDRYFIHEKGRRLETPQIFWMRIAMGLAQGEGEKKNEKAIDFYNVFSTFRFISSTPTLFNAGTLHPQLSSCFLTTVDDDLDHIFKCVKDNAMLSKWSGGLGNDWTSVRALGSIIKGTNGKSQGLVPFLKVANDTAVAVNQGGKRQGAVCAYLESWHLDVEEFLDLRKNTGDDRRRTHDMHTANWIPDLFMKRVLANKDWTLFSPNDVEDLHDLTGQRFEKRYEEYEAMAREGKIEHHKVIPAVSLWRKMLTMLFETGHPWITFKDPSNLRSPQDHTGVVHSSNLCTEILLNTSKDETAVCNLGSINLAVHTTDAGINRKLLADTIHNAIRMLDNVIDINFYPTIEAKNANLRHRPIGMGTMGFQDALHILGLSYASVEAADFADESMEFISYHAILASTELAEERGAYESYKGSKWEKGLIPYDTIELLEKERGGHLDVDRTMRMDWAPVREAIKKHGMRNSNTMAIAPTATIAQITGITQSIEPTYKHLFAKSNLSGEFTAINPYLVNELKALGLWDEQMINDLKYFDGALQEIPRIPQSVKDRFPTAFDIDYEWIIECASRRQKWIDMGQSLNLYLAEPSGKKLHSMYMHAWKKGLKTTYYLRSLGATRIEKSTLDAKVYSDTLGRGDKKADDTINQAALQCSIENGDDCEACQ